MKNITWDHSNGTLCSPQLLPRCWVDPLVLIFPIPMPLNLYCNASTPACLKWHSWYSVLLFSEHMESKDRSVRGILNQRGMKICQKEPTRICLPSLCAPNQYSLHPVTHFTRLFRSNFGRICPCNQALASFHCSWSILSYFQGEVTKSSLTYNCYYYSHASF